VGKYNWHSWKKLKSKDFSFWKKTLSTCNEKYMKIRINFFVGKKLSMVKENNMKIMDDFSLWDENLSMVTENRMKIMDDFSLYQKL
jgi:hypothetical protein